MKQIKNNKNKILMYGLTLGLLCTSIVASATDVSKYRAWKKAIDVEFGIESMKGDSTYSIGGLIREYDGNTYRMHYPISALAWPLDIRLARFSAGMDIDESWRVNGEIKTNIGNPGGQMIDKDWMTLSNPKQLDVYSNANISSFSALMLDINAEWTFLEQESVAVYTGFGFKSQKFKYDSKLVHQYSPSGTQPEHNLYGDGSVGLTYEMTYTMPYLRIGSDFQITPNFSLEGNLDYSPIVKAKDEDHHLLRDKVSKGDMSGNAYTLNVSGTYDLFNSWSVKAGFNYTKISVDGDSDDYEEGYYYGTIQEKSKSTQTSAYLSIGYTF